MSHIPRDFIDDLIQRVDLVDLINARVPLRKHGRSHIACCPFHQEKTPSFHVHRDKQFYYCFGCHATGNAISFLMEYEKASFLEAIEELANIVGTTVPYEQKASDNQPNHATKTAQKNQDYALLNEISHFYHQQLFQHPARGAAVAYLKKRGLTKSIIEQYQIGFAPQGWETLSAQFPNIPKKQLVTLGMLIEKEATPASGANSRFYDRFRYRIMFPIRNRRGHTIGFGGRVLTDEDTPKYLNSPETPVFSKGKELYGLFEVLKMQRQISQLIVVEGYMDVISLTQHGVTNAVATLGTSLTEQHVVQLFHYCEKIIFCFDGDRAGHEAAWRALEQCLPQMHEGRQADFLFLPDKEDPDSYIRKVGVEVFNTQLKKAIPLSRFLIHHLAKPLDLSSLDGKATFLSQARMLLKKLPEGMLYELILDKIAQKIQIPLSRIKELLGNPTASTQALESKLPPEPQVIAKLSTGRLTPAKRALSLLLQNPGLGKEIIVSEKLKKAPSKEIQILVENILITQSESTLSTGQLLGYWQDSPYKAALAQLACYEHLLPPTHWAQEFSDCLKKLEQEANLAQEAQLLHQVAQKEWAELDTDLKEALKEFCYKKEE